MLRTQIQLTEKQAEHLKGAAEREQASISEIVRRAIEQMISRDARISQTAARSRAKAVAGSFSSGMSNVSEDHDTHLCEAFSE